MIIINYYFKTKSYHNNTFWVLQLVNKTTIFYNYNYNYKFMLMTT